MVKEINEFEKVFPDGVYVNPNVKKAAIVRVKAMYDYCNEKGIKPKDLTEKEREQFLIYE
ncbi:hypothetical protein [Bacillus sp. AFS017336]|uniref:hypothetical protein n=1 Tax=Bacillus sp. AFS017336 TaxID=2033489 RepID=UPI000BF204B6|nr:hypothetical protein [Bacillus sp. AFS017336]PEK98316.1 hypothetical protein CN601_25740 [Bacillus sp. AFS017336]